MLFTELYISHLCVHLRLVKRTPPVRPHYPPNPMPPPVPATLLKSVIFPPSRHHRSPPPFIHGTNQKPSPSPSPSKVPIAGPVRVDAGARRIINRIRTTGSIFLIKATSERGKGWWMRPGSGRASLAVSAREPLPGTRRWTGGGSGRESRGTCRVGVNGVQSHALGSLQQRQSEEREVEVDGGYKQEDEEPSQELVTLPTVLTLGRVAAVPLLICTFYMNYWWATTATTGIFLAAAITDWLDGYIARKMQLRTTFGAFLDPVADKLMVAATLVLLCSRPLEFAMFGEVPWLLTVPSIAIIGREITMSAVREWAASQNSKVLEAVAVNNLGKWKTATQMTALTILLLTRDPSLTVPGLLAPSGVTLLYISAGLAVWSLVVYMRNIWRILLK